MEERETGTVKWFDPQKGYGFIVRDQGGDIFLHKSAIKGTDYHSLEKDQRVEYTVVQGERGPRAQDVVVLT